MPSPPIQSRPPFPFVALVGQEEMKLALLLQVVHAAIGGVLLLGDRGTGKSTAVRSLAALMPEIETIEGCPWQCAPGQPTCVDSSCGATGVAARRPTPVVDLPLGSTEDRVTGTLDLEAALLEGKAKFEPGLLAKANRGILYIDEVNLLDDHLVDLLLDVAASGENIVEREAISVRHPARFALVGSGNPEEGELRPQLLDRFGLCVGVATENDVATRIEITRRRLEYDADPHAFAARYEDEAALLRDRLVAAKGRLPQTGVPSDLLARTVRLQAELAIPGHRGELTMARAGRALAALDERDSVTATDLVRVAPLALRHRLRHDPLETDSGEERLADGIATAFEGA